MRTHRAQLGALLLAVGIAACNVLLGYDEGQLATGGSSSTGVGGAATGGGGSTAIGGGGSSVGGSAGAGVGGGSCAPTINVGATSCGDQCTSTTGDTDCDGLPDTPRDPQVDQCNPLLLAFEFEDATDLEPWVLQTGSEFDWSADRCGSVDLGADTSVQLDAATATALTSAYLVEMELTFAGTVAPAVWDATIYTGIESSLSYACSLWRDPTYDPDGGLHLVRTGDGSCGNQGQWTTGAIDDSPGTTYVLQSWHDGSAQYCQLRTPSGAPVLYPLTGVDCPPGANGTVRIRALHRPVSIQWIRVFEIL